MAFLPAIRKLLWACGCGTCACLNFLFAFTALLLTGLVFLNSVQQVIPVPDLIARWAAEKALGSSYRTAWSRADFDLQGGLYLEDIKVADFETGNIILTAGAARIQWAPLHLVTGSSLPFRELDASQVDLFVPAQLSPSGVNEPVLAITHLSAEESGNRLHLRSACLEAGSLNIFLRGSADLRALMGPATSSTSPGTGLERLLVRLTTLPPELSGFVDIVWGLDIRSPHRFDLSLQFDRYASRFGLFEQVLGNAMAEFEENRLSLSRISGSAKISSLNLPDRFPLLSEGGLPQPVQLDLHASGPPTAIRNLRLPRRLETRLSPEAGPLHGVATARLSTDLSRPEDGFNWLVAGPGLFAAGDARPGNGDNPPAGFLPPPPQCLAFRAYLEDPALHDFFPDLPSHRLLENAGAHHLRLNATFDLPSRTLEGTFLSDRLRAGGTDFAHVQSHLLLDPEDLKLTRIHVRKASDETAAGAYFHHFPSSRFSLQARGSIYPSSLDSLLGNWWVSIFTNIEAQHPLPADVTVWGYWRELDSLSSMTAVTGDGALYEGLKVPELAVRIRSNAEWAWLEQLEGGYGDGRFSGRVAWKQGVPDDRRRPMLLEFQSNTPWEVVVAASGIEQLERIGVEGSPEVTARGVLWRPARARPEEAVLSELEIRLNADELPVILDGLELRDLTFRGRVRRNVLDLDLVSGEFAGGVFTGSVKVTDWDNREEQIKDLRIQFFDGSFPEALRGLTGLMEDPEAIRENFLKDNTKGRVDADFQLRLSKSIERSTGTGRLTLRQANIGQIHLFGGLSRLLDSMGLGFSTLDLDSASLEWGLEIGVLSIVQCLITGPVLNLDVNGEVDLVERHISLQADANLFTGLFSAVLAPVSDNFQFDLEGDLSNPSWQLRLRPFRWFQDRLLLAPPAESR